MGRLKRKLLPVGRVALEVLAGLLVGDGNAVALQLGQVHVKGWAAIGQIRIQAHHSQRRLGAARCLLQCALEAVSLSDCSSKLISSSIRSAEQFK